MKGSKKKQGIFEKAEIKGMIKIVAQGIVKIPENDPDPDLDHKKGITKDQLKLATDMNPALNTDKVLQFCRIDRMIIFYLE